jgi:predicted dehydrogenase
MVGMGSIGIQHTRNLSHVLGEKGADFQIDALRTQGKALPGDVDKLVSRTYASFDSLPGDYDVIFINTPTSLHFGHVNRAIAHAKHLFIEKPVFDKTGYPWESLPWRENGVYYVACPLRYHSVVKRLKEEAASRRVFSARAICSSYLPDWRPGTDYRECYSAKAEQGGGVRTDLIHEWDYLTYMFGAPSGVNQFYGTFSDLEITSEDAAVYIAKYSDKLVSLHLDYFGRGRRREVELYTAEDVVIGDLHNQTVRRLKRGDVEVFAQSREDMQRAELAEFFSMVGGERANHNSVADAVGTLRISLGEV